jgi:hypothetical protein
VDVFCQILSRWYPVQLNPPFVHLAQMGFVSSISEGMHGQYPVHGIGSGLGMHEPHLTRLLRQVLQPLLRPGTPTMLVQQGAMLQWMDGWRLVQCFQMRFTVVKLDCYMSHSRQGRGLAGEEKEGTQ